MRAARRAQREGQEVAVITWVPAGAAIPPGMLHSRHHTNQIRVWKRRLSPTSMRWLLGGVDFSLNEDRVGHMAPHWAPHVHGLAGTESIAELRRELKKAAGRAPEITRSTVVKPWDGRLNAAMYPLAGDFDRRVRQQGKRFVKRTRRYVPDRKTSGWRLLASQKLELLEHLDQIGLAQRIFSLRAQVHQNPAGISIRHL